MARITKAEKARTRERVVDAAARDLRAHGVAGTSIPAVMERVGLTHGTFYAYFPTKDALVAEACARGMDETVTNLLRHADAAPPEHALAAVIEQYLSPAHRDDPARGCLLPALAGELRRESSDVRHAFTDAFSAYVDRLTSLPSDGGARAGDDRALVLASGMAGAVLLARAVDDPVLSDRILDACRAFYLESFGPQVGDLPVNTSDASAAQGSS